MSTQRSKPFQWRRDVRNWLASVLQYQQRSGLNLRIAAQHSHQNFPSSALVEFVGRYIEKRLAVWAVKTALREAATSLNLELDNGTLDFLADLAVDTILATA
jgi:hypothetical protein